MAYLALPAISFLRPHIPADWTLVPSPDALYTRNWNQFWFKQDNNQCRLYIDCYLDYVDIWSEVGGPKVRTYLSDPDFLNKVLKAAGIK